MKEEGTTMQNLIRTFLDQLTARLVPLVASLVASSLETARSLLVAEKQAELEETARKYESLGMHEVAANLRTRVGELGQDDLARAGVRLIQNVADGSGTQTDNRIENGSPDTTPRLAITNDLPAQPPKQRR